MVFSLQHPITYAMAVLPFLLMAVPRRTGPAGSGPLLRPHEARCSGTGRAFGTDLMSFKFMKLALFFVLSITPARH